MINVECQVSNLSAMSGREQFVSYVSYVRARAICQLCQGESNLSAMSGREQVTYR